MNAVEPAGRREPTARQRAESLKERVYISFTSLAVVLALRSQRTRQPPAPPRRPSASSRSVPSGDLCRRSAEPPDGPRKTFQQSRTESHDRRQHRGPQRAGDPAPAPRPARVVARGTDSERLEDLECLRGAYQSLPEFSSLTGITADGPPAEVLFRLQAALAAASGRRDGESAPGNPADTGSHSGSQRSATPMAAPGPSRYN